MKILHINTSDIAGGAARAAYRLHQALNQNGAVSTMLVQAKASDDPAVTGPSSKITKAIALMRPSLDMLPLVPYASRKKLFHCAWLPFSGILNKIKQINPDIIHLHWIAGGFAAIGEIAEIGAPVIWSLHDMWPFTGGCHYDDDCGRYKTGCGCCPVLSSGRLNDLSRAVIARKQRAFDRACLVAVNGLSSWISDCARKSLVFSNKRVVNIPNPIDAERYKPLGKQLAKRILGLNPEKKHVLFGAMNPAGDARKGYAELCRALRKLKTRGVEFIVFGAGKTASSPEFDFPSHYMGVLHDDVSLRIVYSAAEVMVAPSLQENLSNIIMESLACGTPVVGFDAGGNKDMIDHKINGYLAAPFDENDLSGGIDWVLHESGKRRLNPASGGQAADECALSPIEKNARETVLRKFDSRIVSRQYLALYNDVLSNSYQVRIK